MKLAIVGSRYYTDYEKFEKLVLNALSEWDEDIECIISGGAKGTDLMAEQFAKQFNIPLKIYNADWGKYGKSAGPIRNAQIVKDATHLIAFPTENGKGTQDTIKKAKDIPIKIYNI